MAKPWPVSAALRAELATAEAAAAVEPHWHDLAGRAIEPNPFYGPASTLAAFRHLPEGPGGRVLLAWRGEGETRRLVGALPLVRPRGRNLNPLPIRRAAACYGTLSTPLVDPDRPAETLAAMLRQAGEVGLHGVLLPFLHEGGPVAAALAETGLPTIRLGGHERAFLRSPLRGAEFMRATLEPRRRKEADRQRRRLADEGGLAFAVLTSGPEVEAALGRFLDLENAGWKGRAGTALKVAPGAAAFFGDVSAAGARDGSFRLATLSLDGRMIAGGLVAVAGRRAFYLKTTYDETYARFSPGLLLTLDLTAHLLDDPEIDDADSIAIADHPMIDRVWTERFSVVSTLVATRPRGGAIFRAAAGLETGRENMVNALKTRIAQWRASRAPASNHPAKKGVPEAAH